MERLVREFRQAYSEHGPTAYDKHIPYLSKLADYYSGRDGWASVVRAHSLYVSCAKRAGESEEEWTRKAYATQAKYWTRNGCLCPSYERQRETVIKLRQQLSALRDKYRRLVEQHGCLFSSLPADYLSLAWLNHTKLGVYKPILEVIPSLSRDLNSEIAQFTAAVVDRAISICGQPPCEFSVVAIGSLARGETTPYSDLEFIFLVEHESAVTDPYFEVLAVTVYLIIGDLGETKLKYMAVHELMDWDEDKRRYTGHWFDDTTVNGFKIDGLGSWAGNIPTGSDGDPQKNKYICTPEDLHDRYERVLCNPDASSLKGDLTAMLASTRHICGSEWLTERLRDLLNQLQPNARRVAANLNMFKQDINKFDFSPSSDIVHKRDVKSDLYRYPSLLTFDLKILNGVQASDPWEVCDELLGMEVLSAAAADCLKLLLCCGVYTRLAAYFHYGSQKDVVSVLGSNPSEPVHGGLWCIPRPLLLHMFLNMMPFKQAVLERLFSGDKIQNIHPTISSGVRVLAAALVSSCCNDQESVISILESHYPGDSMQSAHVFTVKLFIEALIRNSQFQRAERMLSCHMTRLLLVDFGYCALQASLSLLQSRYAEAVTYYKLYVGLRGLIKRAPSPIELCSFYGQVGFALTRHGNYSEAWNYVELSLQTLDKLDATTRHGDETVGEHRSSVYFVKAFIYDRIGKSGKALDFMKKSLDLKLRVYGGVDHDEIARSYGSIAFIYRNLYRNEEALDYYQRSLQMTRRLHGEGDSRELAVALHNITVIYERLCQYDKAYECCEKALNMRLRIFGEADHSDVAVSYNNLGMLCAHLEDYQKSLSYHQKALTMQLRLFSGKDHLEIALSYSNIASAYKSLGQPDFALEYYNKSLATTVAIVGDSDHSYIQSVHSSLGSVHNSLGNYELSLEHTQKAMEMCRRLYGGGDSEVLARLHNNKATVFTKQERYDEALTYSEICLEMLLRLYGSTANYNTASSYTNTGTLYQKKGNYTKALDCHKKALAMLLQIFNGKDHRSIATSYSEMAMLYILQGKRQQGLTLLEKSRDMLNRIIRDQHIK